MATYFAEHFHVEEVALESYGAFNVSLITDLPLFIDPFLLFNSKKPEYQALHNSIIEYLVFLRDKAATTDIDSALLKYWYCFPEVKQNWFGFSKSLNGGTGLGIDFAEALHTNLHKIFPDFGEEKVTRGSHLEKVCLIQKGVGRDNISDFTTNLIKAFLCEYTQKFGVKHLHSDQVRRVGIRGARFNYETESWETEQYDLPWHDGDFVLLTPKDLLTRDDTWINRGDLVRHFEAIPEAIPDAQLRAQVSNHFWRQLARKPGRRERKEPTQAEHDQAAANTLLEFPELIDYFIKLKEQRGDQAESISNEKVKFSQQMFIAQIQALQRILEQKTDFYKETGSTYDEAHSRIAYLKDVIENKGGHRVFYIGGKPLERESDLQVMCRLVWYGTPSDVTTEANDGRGPADFKISRGAKDKTIVEMKLATNTSLKRNLEKQVEIYKKASDAKHGIKVIIYFDLSGFGRIMRTLKELNLVGDRDIVLIDARGDNKPSGSKA